MKNREYRMNVSITKGDATGAAMSRMAQGTTISGSLEEVTGKVNGLLALFAALKPGQFAAYGSITVQNEETGELVYSVGIPSPEMIKLNSVTGEYNYQETT